MKRIIRHGINEIKPKPSKSMPFSCDMCGCEFIGYYPEDYNYSYKIKTLHKGAFVVDNTYETNCPECGQHICKVITVDANNYSKEGVEDND